MASALRKNVPPFFLFVVITLGNIFAFKVDQTEDGKESCPPSRGDLGLFYKPVVVSLNFYSVMRPCRVI